MQDDDKILFFIKRHPAGIIYYYLLTIIAVGVSLALVYWASENTFSLSSSQRAVMLVIMLGLSLVVTLLLLIQTIIYWSNTLTLTDEEVRQNLQTTLFNRKISALGLANVEDVTVEQKGFLATIFNYGTLRIETAGEQSNFNFKYCGNPTECGRKVMHAREQYLERDDKPTRRADVQR